MILIKNQLISIRKSQKTLPSVHDDSFRLKSNIGSNEPRKFQTFLLRFVVNSKILQTQHNWRQMQSTEFVNFSKLAGTLCFRSKCVPTTFGSRKWNNERPTWLPFFFQMMKIDTQCKKQLLTRSTLTHWPKLFFFPSNP